MRLLALRRQHAHEHSIQNCEWSAFFYPQIHSTKEVDPMSPTKPKTREQLHAEYDRKVKQLERA